MEDKKQSRSNEEIAASILDEEKLKHFLDFYEFLVQNKIKKYQSGRIPNEKKISLKYKNKTLCTIGLDDNSWCIRYYYRIVQCENYLTAEQKDFILANINTTSSCCIKGTCHSAENMIIYEKLFLNRVCFCRPVVLTDPDGKTFEYAKDLVLSVITMIDDMVESNKKTSIIYA